MRLALDTNILVYAEGVNGAAMQRQALDLLDRLPRAHVLLPVQVLGELFSVLIRRAARPRDAARAIVSSWRDSFGVLDTSATVMLAAVDLAADHQLGIWDAVILCAAAQSGCRLLLSQDFQHGFTWGGVTVTNPFAAPRDPLLEALISGPPQ